MQTGTILTVDGIDKRFEALLAVDGVSFSGDRKEILGFLGPNGAGKTTTLRMILGIFRPDKGTIRFSIEHETPTATRERTGYLPEERGLYGDAKAVRGDLAPER